MFFCPAAHELLQKWTVSQRHRNFLEPLIQQQPIRLRRQSSRTDSPVVDYCSPGRVKPFGKEKWRDNPAQYIQRTWAITNPESRVQDQREITSGRVLCLKKEQRPSWVSRCASSLKMIRISSRQMIVAHTLPPDLARTIWRCTLETRSATGDVFAATIPNVKHGPIVVKLATTFSRLCRLRHECSVYAYLKSANVKCIPRVYGFYQDAHRCAGALILSNDGGPLGGRRAKLTADEKTRIRAAVSSIHAAGVLHRDLRTWNILGNTDAQDKDIQVEWERLEKLLKGKHVENGEIIGKDGMPANIGDLVNDNPDA
ncbi:hypothetical protein CPB85DRAFT_1262553 [Mucidula mucida]|nr:hypothetical protein CPB85DRAFT_1262553 [Mucidula mucida]